MHARHTAYELREQYVIERYWPVGEAADNLRAVLIAKMVRSAMVKEDAEEIEKIWRMLTGQYDPAKKKKELTMKDVKAAFGVVKGQ